MLVAICGIGCLKNRRYISLILLNADFNLWYSVCKKILEGYFFNFLNAGGNLSIGCVKKYWRDISLIF
jgi:hypothetical protein